MSTVFESPYNYNTGAVRYESLRPEHITFLDDARRWKKDELARHRKQAGQRIMETISTDPRRYEVAFYQTEYPSSSVAVSILRLVLAPEEIKGLQFGEAISLENTGEYILTREVFMPEVGERVQIKLERFEYGGEPYLPEGAFYRRVGP